MSKSTLKILPALMVAITAALVTQPAFGVAIVNNIVITENSNSSTGLTVTYNGSPVTVSFTSSDNWFFSMPGGFLSQGQPQWTEPVTSNLVNYVDFTTNVEAIVHSDILPNGLFNPPAADGAPVQVGTVQGVPVIATFNDLGDTAATVPDTGTTGSLLGLSLMGLALLRRKVC
jgi:VPDSG-CTERM motif